MIIKKTEDFISLTNSKKLPKDIMNKQRNDTRYSIDTCRNIINKTTKQKHTNMNPMHHIHMAQ